MKSAFGVFAGVKFASFDGSSKSFSTGVLASPSNLAGVSSAGASKCSAAKAFLAIHDSTLGSRKRKEKVSYSLVKNSAVDSR